MTYGSPQLHRHYTISSSSITESAVPQVKRAVVDVPPRERSHILKYLIIDTVITVIDI